MTDDDDQRAANRMEDMLIRFGEQLSTTDIDYERLSTVVNYAIASHPDRNVILGEIAAGAEIFAAPAPDDAFELRVGYYADPTLNLPGARRVSTRSSARSPSRTSGSGRRGDVAPSFYTELRRFAVLPPDGPRGLAEAKRPHRHCRPDRPRKPESEVEIPCFPAHSGVGTGRTGDPS